MHSGLKVVRFVLVFFLLAAGFRTVSARDETQVQWNCGSTYVVQPGDILSVIAEKCGVSYRELLAQNPQIDHPGLIRPGQVITIPEQRLNGIYIPVTGGSTYVVKPGDTLNSISDYFSVSTASLTAANPWLRDVGRVYPGMRLTLPRLTERAPALTVTPSIGSVNSTLTLAATGFRANTEVMIGFGPIAGPIQELDRATTDSNGAVVREYPVPAWATEMRGDYVFAIQNREYSNIRAISNYFNLVMPQPASAVIPIIGGPAAQTYVVKAGDTLEKIAGQFQTIVERLIEANPSLSTEEELRAGLILYLPPETLPDGPGVVLSNTRVKPGDAVTVRAYHFPASASVDLLLTPQGSTYIQPYDGRTDAQGRLLQTIRIPSTAVPGRYNITVKTTERAQETSARSVWFDIIP